MKICCRISANSIALLIILVLGVNIVRGQLPEQKKPNIVFILADDLGYSDVNSFYPLGDADYYDTPNIDRLASQGMMFLDAYTNAANCAPTRAALMSGQYYPRQPVYTVGSGNRGESKYRNMKAPPNGDGLPRDIYTMAEALEDAGYATGHFGKWHLGPAGPEEQGFSKASVTGVDVNGVHLDQQPKLGPGGEYIAEELNKKALQFIEENQDEPFFLYLPHFIPHSPFEAPISLVEKYLKKRPVMGHYHAKYAAMIEALDNSVGKVMKKLDELGLTKDTMLIFTSDNGGMGGYIDQGIKGMPRLEPLEEESRVEITHNAPLRGGKGQYYEGGIRVPLIIRWPGVIKAGTKTAEPVITIDFYPTLIELTGTKISNKQILDGVSLLPLLQNPEVSLSRDALYWHFPGYLQTRQPGSWRTTPVGVIRDGDWKLIQFFEENTIELYNLADDIGEHYNLADIYKDKSHELLKKLESWRRELDAPMPRPK